MFVAARQPSTARPPIAASAEESSGRGQKVFTGGERARARGPRRPPASQGGATNGSSRLAMILSTRHCGNLSLARKLERRRRR